MLRRIMTHSQIPFTGQEKNWLPRKGERPNYEKRVKVMTIEYKLTTSTYMLLDGREHSDFESPELGVLWVRPCIWPCVLLFIILWRALSESRSFPPSCLLQEKGIVPSLFSLTLHSLLIFPYLITMTLFPT